MRKVKVGILTFGDGREFLKKDLEPVNAKFQKRLKDALVADGFEVVAGEEVIWTNPLAVKYGHQTPKSPSRGSEVITFLMPKLALERKAERR